MSRLKELARCGQSPWYDNISRDLLTSGKIQKMIEEDGIMGVTSNPSIFEKAIKGSAAYDADIEKLSREGKSAEQIYDELSVSDVARAADILKELYYSTNRQDGYVSIEVSPRLAHDTDGTIAEAKRLHTKIQRPNVMIKVPATPEGIEAIHSLTAQGLSINATLIFSLSHYNAVASAYIRGMDERVEKKLEIDNIASVASFFISRIDSTIDRMLNRKMLEERDQNAIDGMQALVGNVAVAQSKVLYVAYQQKFYGPDFYPLQNKGARVQRLLFGSTSTKNSSYSDVKYVEEVIGKGTVNTMPEVTLNAFKDHGKARVVLGNEIAEARELFSKLNLYGISFETVCQELQNDGLQAFVQSHKDLLKVLEAKRQKFVTSC